MTHSTSLLLSSALVLSTAACVTTPYNDRGGSDPASPVAFEGYAYRPNSRIEIRAKNKATGQFELVGSTTSRSYATTLGGASLYSWSGSATLYNPAVPTTACRFRADCTLRGSTDVVVRVTEVGVSDLPSFEHDGVQCVMEKLQVGIGWLNAGSECRSGESPNMRVLFDFAEAGQVVPAAHDQIAVPPAWASGRGAGVRVAIIDSGIDLTNPDLPTPVASRSFVVGASSVQDGYGSGTVMASVIAARDNDIGIVGVAPEADLLVARVVGDSGVGQASWLASGIDWAAANGADIIVVGLATGSDSPAVRDAVNRALGAGVFVMASTGDFGGAQVYPASYAGVFGVGQVDDNNEHAASGGGPQVDVVAPRVAMAPVVGGNGLRARLAVDGVEYVATMTEGSAIVSATGSVYDCGQANNAGDCPEAVAGNIALVRRGATSFATKVDVALAQGAVGVVIANNEPGSFFATINGERNLPIVSVGSEVADALIASAGEEVRLAVYRSDYAHASGKAVAAAYAAGVAALVHEQGLLSEEQLESTAIDLGAFGPDTLYGHGLINAAAAVLP